MRPLIVLLGPTASGKTSLSLALAQRFGGEILSCDSVAVYRHMELGTAKPSLTDRALVPHHCLDLYDPTEACTAGDYARHAREALASVTGRSALPILSGGTGLYARALLDGLHPAPPANPALRLLLRRRVEVRGAQHLHETLLRMDARAAKSIHANDIPKAIRAIEVSLASRRPMTAQWEQGGRNALTGYRVLRLALDPAREELYHRINVRAKAMFLKGLVEETRGLIERFGVECRPFTSLGYAEAAGVLRGELTLDQAVSRAQQGHRNYSKRQMTWFRRETALHPTHWLPGTGDDPAILTQATALIEATPGHTALGDMMVKCVHNVDFRCGHRGRVAFVVMINPAIGAGLTMFAR